MATNRPGDGVARQVGQRLRGPQGAVGGHQVVAGHDARDGGVLGGPEEDADAGDDEDDGEGEPDVARRRQGQRHDEPGPQEVGRDHREPLVPAIHERAGDGRDQEVGHGRHQEDQGRGEGRARDGEDEDAQRHLVDAIAEGAHRLTEPEGGEAGIQGQADQRLLAQVTQDRADRPAGRVPALVGSKAPDPRPVAVGLG